MKIDWGTGLSVLIVLALAYALYMVFTKRHIDTKTGQVVTSFSGLSGNDVQS